jgi:hypothetical protein
MSATRAARGPQTPGGPTRGARFTAVMAAVAGRLPFGLSRLVPARLLGFAVISSITFTVDLALLTAFHGGLRWPLPVAITAAYVLASGLGYLLNRTPPPIPASCRAAPGTKATGSPGLRRGAHHGGAAASPDSSDRSSRGSSVTTAYGPGPGSLRWALYRAPVGV